ncbi:SAM-dependent methyltransferase [Stackebrandtia soli]
MIVDVGPVAHGGHCVARADGVVIFVRHALPGERVRIEVTDRKKTYWLADAVEILTPSPDRVEAPCRFAGLCGGCDFQHVSAEGQLSLKTTVLREQLTRLGGLSESDVAGFEVEALPGGLLDWRTRVQYAVTRDGRPGLRMHHSHDIVHIDECVIADPKIRATDTLDRTWPGSSHVGVVAGDNGEVSVYTQRGRQKRGIVKSGPKTVVESLPPHQFHIDADAFWQVHPAAAGILAATVTGMLGPLPGETAWDLYAGAGLFTVALAEAIGDHGAVVAVESDPRCRAEENLAKVPGASVMTSTVQSAIDRLPKPDVVVMDPPRSGAGKELVAAIAAARPRSVVYVACDPAALARDLREFAGLGYRLADLASFDAFPMTHHFETVAQFDRVS